LSFNVTLAGDQLKDLVQNCGTGGELVETGFNWVIGHILIFIGI